MSQGNKNPSRRVLISGDTMRPEIAVDQEQILRAKHGDLIAFEALVKKYQKMIYGLCYRLTRNHETANDLSQETFLKAFTHLGDFLVNHDFYSWLRRIALNLCFSYWRRRKKEARRQLEAMPGDQVAGGASLDSPADALERTEAQRKLEQALFALPEDQRAIFILRTYENLGYQEIAQALNLAPGTVMSRLNRARKKLKKALASLLGERQ